MKKMKVVWITHLANPQLNARLKFKITLFERIKYLIRGISPELEPVEKAVWNTNAINEIKEFSDEIELHLIAPYEHLAVNLFEFNDNNIHYHFFHHTLGIIDCLLFYFFHIGDKYLANTKIILSLIDKIDPDIIEVIGIENPAYAASTSYIDSKYPLFVQLQTLVNDPNFEKNYPISHKRYLYLAKCEKNALIRADYVCTPVSFFKDIVKTILGNDVKFVNKGLALGENVNLQRAEKCFDFVYFSANIDKAGDYAIEAFIEASKIKTGITLDVVGQYDAKYKRKLEERLNECELLNYVRFEGRLPSHDDVIRQIRKSKYALLPLKIDLISGTIRESMANGLPVISTITPLTPSLNKERNTILISEPGNHVAMAKNMCRLIGSPVLAEELRANGALYISETYSNNAIMREWVDAYKALLKE